MHSLSHNIHLFDNTLFGFVNLSRAAIGSHGIYWPAMVIVLGSAVAQYFQSKQLLPDTKDKRSLRTILKEAGSGKQADQSEVNAAVGRSTRYLLPVMIFLFTVNIASALSLYWLVGNGSRS
jgi:membrane protein insertase Oxa1/YidC/SpoIIIJ